MLRKKMWRDLWEQKGSFFSMCIVMAMGLWLFIAMYMAMGSLEQAIEEYYAEYRFGDVFAQVVSMPEKEAERLAELSGIEQVTARFTREVRVLWTDSEENVFVRLISFAYEGEQALNQPHIFSGTPWEDKGEGIYLTPGFAEANNLTAGSYLPVLINGRQKELLVLGIAQSPEYVYAVSGKDEIFPNDALFGVAMMPKDFMNQLFNTTAEANLLSFSLSQGVTYAEAEAVLAAELKEYGLLELLPRKDQISHFMLETEVAQMGNMGRTIPGLMLIIAAIIMVISLRRRVDAQRGQIGILLAFGYTRGEIMWHYLSYGLVVGTVGAALGVSLGLFTMNGFVDLYQVYFKIPGFQAQVFPRYLALAFVLALSCSLAASAYGCRDVLKLKPAEAMRPPTPLTGRRVWLEQLTPFWNSLTITGRMAVRNMIRTPFRSVVSLVGVGLVFAMMAVVFSFQNMLQVMITDQYEKIEVYDVKVSFTSYLKDSQIRRELAGFSGVELVETVLEIPCQLSNQNLIKDVVLVGLAADARLLNILDQEGRLIRPANSGVIISETLADKLAVSAGSVLYMENNLLPDPCPVVVQAVVPQYIGSNMYMEQQALWQLLGKGEVVSAAALLAPEEVISALKSEYRTADSVKSITRADTMFAMVTDYMDSYVVLIYIMGLVVSVVGFIIVYNAAVISFSERSRELASLLVLGLYDHEVAEVISFEQWVLSFLGMGLGVPLALAINYGFSAALQNDVYAMPTAIPLGTLFLTAAVTCLYMYVAQRWVKKKVRHLQIVDVLKERE